MVSGYSDKRTIDQKAKIDDTERMTQTTMEEEREDKIGSL